MKVYPASPRRQKALLGVWLLLMLLPAGLMVGGAASGDTALITAGAVVGGMITVVLVPIFWLSAWRYPRLILDEDGLTVRQLGMRLESSWDNVAGLRTQGGVGIVLNGPMQGGGAGTQAAFSGVSLGGAPLTGGATQQLMRQKRYIPIDVFAYWLDHGDLAMELASRAPHLTQDLQGLEEGRVGVSRRRPLLADADGNPVPARNLAVAGAVILAALVVAGLIATGAPHANALLRGVQVLLALGLAGYSVANVVAARRSLRDRRYIPAIVWSATAVVQFLLALYALSVAFPPGA